MSTPNEHEHHANELVDKFERGELSRRELIAGVAGIGALTFAAEARATGGIAPLLLNATVAGIGDRERDPGRKILLERIMNHTYIYLNDTDNQIRLGGNRSGTVTTAHGGTSPVQITSASHGLETGEWIIVAGTGSNLVDGRSTVTRISDDQFKLDYKTTALGADISTGTWSQSHKIFDEAKEHQAWLFGAMHPDDNDKDYTGSGLKNYDDRNNKQNAVKDKAPKGAAGDDIEFHNPQERQIGGATARADLRVARTKADNQLNVFQLGDVSANYNFDDLYGLVRLKIDHVCSHCASDGGAGAMLFLKNSPNFAEVQVVGVNVSDDTKVNVKVSVKEVISNVMKQKGAWDELAKVIAGIVHESGPSPDIVGDDIKQIFENDGVSSLASSHGEY